MEKANKAAVVEEVSVKLKDATTTVLADYRGLTVKAMSELRRGLRAEGVEFKIYKNTMIRRAVDKVDIEGLSEHLVGPTALAFGYDDPISAAKLLAAFAKDHKALEIKCGLIEGKFVDAAGMKAAASLPTKDVLLAKLAGALQGPVAGLANVLNAPLRGLAVALDQVAQGKSE